MFALHLQSLVGLLQSLEGTGGSELASASHVQRILGKHQPQHHAGFMRHAYTSRPGTRVDLLCWLQFEGRCPTSATTDGTQHQEEYHRPERRNPQLNSKAGNRTTVLHRVD
ncbi:hypothetical protein AAFF_G00034530 [Aldrovandia affinis]|uniref:Secreted protein n=1 Tax=Aldrovandia affinis TaxID=143900 RepID=A0AAD7S3E7_9TELE|nr:hypothetical protein AAFF_G00034530 [Aldrovandia affinis]